MYNRIPFPPGVAPPEGPIAEMVARDGQFDPALGRGYRIGNVVRVPAGAGIVSGRQPIVLCNHGWQNRILRWRVTLQVTTVNEGPDPNPLSGESLRFIIMGKMENDRIWRRCRISLNDAQVLFTPGRSISVLAFNPNNFDLDANYQIDEYTAGISRWEDSELFAGLAAETALDIPPFCDFFQVLSPGAAAPPARVRGYAPGGLLVYEEVLTTPRSPPIERTPNLDYTISPTGPLPQNHMVLYICVG